MPMFTALFWVPVNSMRVLIPDTWHFHRRNFRPIFQAISQKRFTCLIEQSRKRWWQAHGDYTRHAPALAESLAFVHSHPIALWPDLTTLGINLWAVAKAEFLCRVLPDERWYSSDLVNDAAEVFDFAIETPQDQRTLALCLAASRDWILFWNRLLTENPDLTHALVFSGSYIYTHALLKVSEQRQISAFVLEHFFTGEDFYCEQKYEPVSRNSQLASPQFLASLALQDTFFADAYAAARLRNSKNKNVSATEAGLSTKWLCWGKSDRVVLVVGQVLNDFSLLESEGYPLSSIVVYQQLILRVLEATDCKVLFKSHPWERKRANLLNPQTLLELKRWSAQLPQSYQRRLVFCENEPLDELFRLANHVVGISSQGLLEACQRGFKPWVLGKAFFSNHGFTHEPESLNQLTDYINGNAMSRLTFSEFECYKNFINKVLCVHLVPNTAGDYPVFLDRMEPGHVGNSGRQLKVRSRVDSAYLKALLMNPRFAYVALVGFMSYVCGFASSIQCLAEHKISKTN